MRFLIFIFLLIELVKSQPANNIEILNKLVEASFLPVKEILDKNAISSCKLNILIDEPIIRDLVRTSLYQSLTYDSTSLYLIDVIQKKYIFHYPEIISFPIFGSPKYRREIQLNLTYLISRQNDLIYKYTFNETYSDTVDSDYFDNIMTKLESQTNLPKIPLLRALVEPTIITGLTGIIVYLFFTVRSK